MTSRDDRRRSEFHERLALKYATQGAAALSDLSLSTGDKVSAMLFLALALHHLALSDPQERALDMATEMINGRLAEPSHG